MTLVRGDKKTGTKDVSRLQICNRKGTWVSDFCETEEATRRVGFAVCIKTKEIFGKGVRKTVAGKEEEGRL